MNYGKKYVAYFLLLSGLVFWTGCDKESEGESYIVDIAIEAPATVQVGEAFEVEVKYTRSNDVIHNVLIEIVNEQGHQTMQLEERHVHEANNYTFQKDNLVIDKTGTYTLRASTTDMHEGMEHGGEHGGEMPGHDADSTEHDKEHNTVEHSFVVQ